jgi:hypothetical protein
MQCDRMRVGLIFVLLLYQHLSSLMNSVLKYENRGNYSIAGVCDQSLKATTTLFA